MPSNRILLLTPAAFFVFAAACMTQDAATDRPPCCDAGALDAALAFDALADGPDRDRAPKLPPPTHAPLGAACLTAADCESAFCVDGVCCASACDISCYACNQAGLLGTCAALDGVEDISASAPCAGTRVCVTEAPGTSSCKLREGEACLSSAECAGGACRSYYTDDDRDGFGASGSPPAFSRCDVNPNAPPGYSASANDCCDSDPAVSPSAVSFSTTRDRCASYDWNCNGVEERQSAQGCPTAGGQPVGCGQACSVAFKGSVSILYVQACR
jgi:hypothetical protein